MIASEARIRANRLNAQKSTGPTTAEGKAASRANAYKHGLTGSGVVGPDDERAAVDLLSADLREELRPATPLGSVLVDRLAILAVRMDRCGRRETAAIAQRARNASAEFEDRRADEADAAFARLLDAEDPIDPNPLLRKLRRTPEGLTRLIQGWADLAEAIRRPDLSPWSAAHLRAFEALSGRRPTDLSPSRAALIARVLPAGDPSGLPPAEAASIAALDPQARAAWARDRLVDLIAAEVDDLKATYNDLDFDSIGLDHAGAATRALFDPSHEATLARKYEAAAERSFYRTLREFEQTEAAVGPFAIPGPEAGAPRGSLGSFFRGHPGPLRPDRPTPPSPRPGPVEAPEELPLRSTKPSPFPDPPQVM